MSETGLVKVISFLKSRANPKNVAGMARFGINPAGTLGVSIPILRQLAKKIKKEHRPGNRHILSGLLWDSGIHEARILAALIDDPSLVTETQMEKWVRDFDSWDVCDGVCSNLFDKTRLAYQKARAWSGRKAEYIKRAGFVLMACLAVHDKQAPDITFSGFFPLIVKGSRDQRNFVKKAVNWALRQIGKRNPALMAAADKLARRIMEIDSPAARWIAGDARREFEKIKMKKYNRV